MDNGLIAALIVMGILAFVGGIAGGVFFGLWWQARQTAKVWETAYTHVREIQFPRAVDTYNTGREPPPPALPTPQSTTLPHPLPQKDRVVVQAATSPPPPPVAPSPAAQSFGVTLEDDPLGNGNRLDR